MMCAAMRHGIQDEQFISRLTVCLGMLLLCAACAEGRPTATEAPAAPLPTVAPSPAMPAPTEVPTPSATPAATATVAPATPTPMATPSPAPEPPRPLPSLQPLAETEIVDRPLRNVRALTDGSRKYRGAAWGPGVPYVALVPQDGPGMDLVDIRTGEVTAVVTASYVLEPQWTDDGELLVHRTERGRDSLTLYDPERGFASAPMVEGPLLSAPSHAAGMLAFAREGQVLVCLERCAGAPIVVASGGALVTAPAPDGPNRGLLAWTPEVDDLEEVQTLVMATTGARSTEETPAPRPLSSPGEGLWLPRWSPDGTWVALTGIGGRLAIVAADGSARYDLGPGDAPAWSPDGTLIAYTGASAGLDYTTRNLHLIRADGSGGRVQLTDAGDEEFYVSPSWSPDGRQLAFVELDSGRLFIGDLPGP